MVAMPRQLLLLALQSACAAKDPENHLITIAEGKSHKNAAVNQHTEITCCFFRQPQV